MREQFVFRIIIYLWISKFIIASKFEEKLFVENLNTALLLNFDFATYTESIKSDQFPKSISDLVLQHYLYDLKFSLSRGFWDTKKWGVQPVVMPSQAAEIKATFDPLTDKVDEKWWSLSYSLSGLLCASLSRRLANMKDYTRGWSMQLNGTEFENNDFVRMSIVPSEPFCTENLTPWFKLLPCGGKVENEGGAGLVQLVQLMSTKLFHSHFLGLHLSISKLCLDSPQKPMDQCIKTGWKLHQSITVVLDRVMNGNIYNTWSLKDLIGINFDSIEKCQLAESSRILIGPGFSLANSDSSNNSTNEFDLMKDLSSKFFSIDQFTGKWQSINANTQLLLDKTCPIIFEKHSIGTGNIRSGIKSVLINRSDRKIKINYLDNLSWYFKIRIYTLKVTVDGKVARLVNSEDSGTDEASSSTVRVFYQPSIRRHRPAHLEMLIEIPAHSKVTVEYEIKKELQYWNEYPPDANHEFSISPSIATFLSPSGRITQLHSPGLVLITMPCPDFSMPFNALCLACTVVSILVGSVHKFTTCSFTPTLCPAESDKSQATLMQRICRIFKRT